LLEFYAAHSFIASISFWFFIIPYACCASNRRKHALCIPRSWSVVLFKKAKRKKSEEITKKAAGSYVRITAGLGAYGRAHRRSFLPAFTPK
jgi:hypothetical protein